MFPQFKSRFVLTREYIEDSGGLAWPFVLEPRNWFWACERDLHAYLFIAGYPFAWLVARIYYVNAKLRYLVARRWFTCRLIWLETESDHGMIPEIISKWHPRYWPYDECIVVGNRIRWRDLAIYTCRRLRRWMLYRNSWFTRVNSKAKNQMFKVLYGIEWQKSGYPLGTYLTWWVIFKKFFKRNK